MHRRRGASLSVNNIVAPCNGRWGSRVSCQGAALSDCRTVRMPAIHLPHPSWTLVLPGGGWGPPGTADSADDSYRVTSGGGSVPSCPIFPLPDIAHAFGRKPKEAADKFR